MRKALALLLLVGLLGLLAACGSDDDESEPEAAAPTEAADTGAAEETDACATDQLNLVSDGTLTIGTDNPAFPPWFQDAEGAPWDPTTEPTKMGYEAAVAYAVAGELGFPDDAVQWVVVPFDNVFRPGPKDFDFDINQTSYLPARDEAVDFSDSYYDVEQAVVTLGDSDFAGATSLAELKGAKLGAQVGTTSLNAINDVIQPNADPDVYSTNNDAVSALKNGRSTASSSTIRVPVRDRRPGPERQGRRPAARGGPGVLRARLRGRQPAPRLRERGDRGAPGGRGRSRVPGGVDQTSAPPVLE